HTRFSRDWSSDVCSSDLAADQAPPAEPDASVSSDAPLISPPAETDQIADLAAGNDIPAANIPAANDEAPALAADAETTAPTDTEIGRASCREREQIAGIV